MLDPDEDTGAAAAAKEAAQAARIERERAAVLSAVANSEQATVMLKVAWILNAYPEARNSDITLQLLYWDTFCPEYGGGSIAREELYALPRLITLTRFRQRIQNTLRLFEADQEIRKRRGTLRDEERDAAVEAKSASAPLYAVYVDESGKGQAHLVVGSLWVLQAPAMMRLVSSVQDWRERSGFKAELHFGEVTEATLPYFKEAIDIVLSDATACSFKYISVRRAGLGPVSTLIPKLIYHLLVRGIAHEHATGRAPLPRNLQVWKDAEETEYDRLVLAELHERLLAAAVAQFNGDLIIDRLQAVDSRGFSNLQIADLFTSSVNRILNPPDPPPKGPSPKDQLARHVISRTGLSMSEETDDQEGDMAVRINL